LSAAPPRAGRRWPAPLFLAAATGAEAWAWLPLLLDPAWTLPRLLSAHAGVALATLGGAAVLYRRGERSPLLLLFALSLAFLGPLGVAGSATAAALRRVFALRALPFARWHEALFPPQETNPTRALYERVVLRGGGPGRRSTVAPFVDVMALGTVQEKQAVIAMMAEGYRPAFAGALTAGLNDPEAAIRVQSASAVAHIESGFLRRAMALEARIAAAPEDPEAHFAMARLHEEHWASGLLDEGRRRETALRALACAIRHVELAGGRARPEVADSMARLLLSLGRAGEALEALRPSLDRADPSPTAVGLHLECLFRLGRFQALRAACRRHCGRSGLPDEIHGAALLWAEGAGAAEVVAA
jgi:polysaccharide biosynthesis protein PelE